MATREEKYEWQSKGGMLEIPDGYIVSGADFDADEPHIQITSKEDYDDTKKIPVPKSMAYYLSIHFCGSNMMRDLIREGAARELQNTIKDALGL